MKNPKTKFSPNLLLVALFTLLCLCGLPGNLAVGQTTNQVRLPDCQIFLNFSTTGNSTTFDNRTTACNVWMVSYQASAVGGTVTVVSLTLQSAPGATVAGAFVTYPGTVGSGANPATNAAGLMSTFTNGTVNTPWMRVNLGTFTHTGTGTLNGVLYGWKMQGNPTTTSGGGGGGCSDPCVVIQPDGTLLNAQVAGAGADGAAAVGNPVRIGGKDGSNNTQDITTDATGNIVPANAGVAGADGVSNTIATPTNQSGTQVYGRFFPYIFNGATNDRQFACNSHATISTSASGNTQLVALSGTTIFRICHVSWTVTSGTPIAVKITGGTGSNCATGGSDTTGVYTSSAVALDFSPNAALRGVAGDALCINLGTATAVTGTVVYAQF